MRTWKSWRRRVGRVALGGLHLLRPAIRILRRRRVIVYYSHVDFGRKAGAIADLLRRRNFPVELYCGLRLREQIRLATSDDLWIGFWNEVPVRFLPMNYIFFNAEPLDVAVWGEDGNWMSAMRGARMVWDYKLANAKYVKPTGVPFRHVPFGYAPYYESSFRANTQSAPAEKDVDVLFFGGISERRRRVLDLLRESGLHVCIVSREKPVHGGDLDRLLVRAKIVLGMHGFDDPSAQIADLARLDHLLSNRLFVIHERPSAVGRDVDFEQNVVTCEYDQIVSTCLRYVRADDERSRLANLAHDWFKRTYSMDSVLPYDDVVRFWGGDSPSEAQT